MVETAILGATGYTGVELVRLLRSHPEAEISFISSESHAGRKMSAVHPQFYGQFDLTLQPMKIEEIPSSVGVVFCALPHGKSASAVAALLERGMRVIDLSADFRLHTPALYRQWYDLEHPHPALLGKAVYGLPELYREEIAAAQLVANPGCYPTSIILALAPLMTQPGIVAAGSLIIDAKSGASGAGRVPRQPFHFPDCTENFKAYRVASHQHTAEIEQELGRLAQTDITITFTPHLVPMVRGIFSTIYGDLNSVQSIHSGQPEQPKQPEYSKQSEQSGLCNQYEKELQGLYRDFYRQCLFVRVLEEGALPETRFVRGSNYCDLALKLDRRTGKVIILSVIDNLVKGASGQAVQNMNIMCGYPEQAGLGHVPL